MKTSKYTINKNPVHLYRDSHRYIREVVDDYGTLHHLILQKPINRWVIVGPKGVISAHNDITIANTALSIWKKFFDEHPQKVFKEASS